MGASHRVAKMHAAARMRLLAAVLGAGVGVMTGHGIAAAGPNDKAAPSSDSSSAKSAGSGRSSSAGKSGSGSKPGSSPASARPSRAGRTTDVGRPTRRDVPRADPRTPTPDPPTSKPATPNPPRRTGGPNSDAAGTPGPAPAIDPTPAVPAQPSAAVRTVELLDVAAVTAGIEAVMTAAPEPVESTPTAPPAEPMKPARPAEPMKPARPAEPTGLAPSAKPNVLPPSAWLLQWGVRGEADSNFPWLVEPTDPVVAVLTGIPTDTGNPTDTGTGDWFETVATVPIAATGAVPVTALSGEEATTVYYTPDGAHAYLLQPRWDGVHLVVVDTATGRTTPVIVVPGAPPSAIPTGEDGPDLWFGPDGTHAYLVTSRRVEPEPSPAGPARYPSYVTDLTIIETATGAATTTELGPGASYQVVFAPNGGRLYTLGYTVSDTGRRTDRLTVVDIATGRVLDVIGLTDPADIGRGRPTGALTPDGRHLYVAGDSGYAVDLTIVRVGTTTGERSEIVRTNVPGRGFGFLKTTSDDAVGYLASTEPDTSSANGYRTYLTAVDLTDGTTRRVTTAPGTAVDLGFAPDGRLGYLITKANDARSFAAVTYLTELDLARDSSTAITVAGAPEPLVFDSTGNRIYLTTHSYDRSTRASSTLLTTIDTVAGETGTRVGPETAAPVVTQGGAQIYLAASDHDTTTLTRIDTASGASNTLDRAGARTALSVTPDRARLVLSTVTDADTPAARSTVTAVDTASGNPTATVTLPGTTDDLVIDDSGRHAYLTAELRDPNGALSTVLTRIDTTTGATDTVDVRAGRPMRVDFAPDTRSVYLTTWVVDVGPVITLIRLS